MCEQYRASFRSGPGAAPAAAGPAACTDRPAPTRLGLEEKPSTIRTLNMPPEEMPWLLLIVQVLEMKSCKLKVRKPNNGSHKQCNTLK